MNAINNTSLKNSKIGSSIISTHNKLTDKNSGTANKIKIALGVAAFVVVAPKLIVKVIIPAIRKLVYVACYSRMKFSDYLEVQADLIEANANELQYSDSGLDEDQKQKVIKKQLKVAEKFRKWSNIFSIDKKQSENNANKAISEDEKDKKRVGKDGDGEDVLF